MEFLNNRELIVFDVETTGLSPVSGDRVIEIAALKVKDSKPVDKFYSLLDPQREISMGAYMVNGISQEMLSGAPLAGEVLPRFLDFVGDGCLVGHNVQFDLGFLRYELSLIRQGLSKDVLVLDTLKMSRILLPQLRSHRLWLVARELGVSCDQQHRAMADVEMTFSVLQGLLALARKNNSVDLKNFMIR